MDKLELKINGMECSGCEVLLERNFLEVKGVIKARVNHAAGKAILICSSIPSLESLQNAIKDTKYSISIFNNESKKDKATLQVKREHIEILVIFLIITVL